MPDQTYETLLAELKAAQPLSREQFRALQQGATELCQALSADLSDVILPPEVTGKLVQLLELKFKDSWPHGKVKVEKGNPPENAVFLYGTVLGVTNEGAYYIWFGMIDGKFVCYYYRYPEGGNERM